MNCAMQLEKQGILAEYNVKVHIANMCSSSTVSVRKWTVGIRTGVALPLPLPLFLPLPPNCKVLGTPISVIESTEDRNLFDLKLKEINEKANTSPNTPKQP